MDWVILIMATDMVIPASAGTTLITVMAILASGGTILIMVIMVGDILATVGITLIMEEVIHPVITTITHTIQAEEVHRILTEWTAIEIIAPELLGIIRKIKLIVTEEQTIEILLIVVLKQVLLLQEIKIRIILSVILTEEQAQTALAAKAILLQDLTHQIQEVTVIFQLQDHIAQTQIIPIIAVGVEDHHLEVEEDNFYIYFE